MATPPGYPETPNLDKALKSKTETEAIGEFVEWLGCEKKIFLARRCAMQSKERGYNIFLTEKENLILSACTTIAAISSRIPEVFDTVQLDTRQHPTDAPTHYAKAMSTLIDNEPDFLSLTQKLNAALDESQLRCLCGDCQMTEQSCRHKRVGPSKPRPIELFCPSLLTEDMYLISGKELEKLQITHGRFAEVFPALTTISEQVILNILDRGKIIWGDSK